MRIIDADIIRTHHTLECAVCGAQWQMTDAEITIFGKHCRDCAGEEPFRVHTGSPSVLDALAKILDPGEGA